MKEIVAVFGMFACVAGVAVLVISQSAKDDKPAERPVFCSCSCPEQQKCAESSGIVADGYNVNIVVDGEKWTPPALLTEDEQGYVTLCRKEDPELIHHPDLSFTKTYKMWLDCNDELYQVRSGYDDEANQTCWQQDVFELPLPKKVHVMTEAEHQEEMRGLDPGPGGL